MKPRNKKESFVFNIQKQTYVIKEEDNHNFEKRKPLSNKFINWSKSIHSKIILFSYKKKHHCTECAHTWDSSNEKTIKSKKTICPNCNEEIIVDRYNNKESGKTESIYLHKIEVVQNHQVIRIFKSSKTFYKNKKPHFFLKEVCQHWFNEKGEYFLFSLKGGFGSGYYADNWCLHSSIEPRSRTFGQRNRTDITMSNLYSIKKFAPFIKKLGIKNSVHGITPEKLIEELFKNNKLETLVKLKDWKAVDFIVKRGGNKDLTEKYWKSYLITRKKKYKIKDIGLWLDLLWHLSFFNKDVKSPKYICPENLKYSHNKWVEKKKRHDKEEKFKKLKNSIEKDNKYYQKEKSKFFGLLIKKEDLIIEPIKSVKEVYEEAEELNHCLFSREYHKKKESLLLSAKKDGKRLETIEFSLKTMKILQSRGNDNVPTKYNKNIVELVQNNINLIQKAAI